MLEYYRKALFSGIFAFVILFTTMFLTLTPFKGDFPLVTWNVGEDPSNLFNENLQTGKFYFVPKKPTYVVIETEIPESAYSKFNTDLLYLFIPQIDTSYFEIYADGKLLGSFGDPKTKSAHLWYQPLFFTIPKDTKIIQFKIYGIYEIGMDFIPFLTKSLTRYNTLSFITRILLPMFMGMAFMNALILIFVSRNIELKKRKYYELVFFATFFGVFWMFDILPFESLGTPFSFLILRKIFISSAYMGFVFLIKGLSHSYGVRNKLVNYSIIFLNIATGFLVIFAPTNYHLKIFSSNITPILILNSVYVMYKIAYSYSTVLFGFTTFFVLTVIHDALIMFLTINSKFLSSFGIAALFSGFAYNLILEYKELSLKEQLAYARSITDQLTGSFNRGILNDLTLNNSDCLVYFDLNKFKTINDTYGHDVGDVVLRNLVSSIKNNIRVTDIVVRMGGDEFLAILRNCLEEKAKEIAEKILEDFKNSHPLQPTFSYGVKAVEGNLATSIRKVDSLMYEMKEKNRQ